MDSLPSFRRFAVASLLCLAPGFAAAQESKAAQVQSCLQGAGVQSLIEGDATFATENVQFQKRFGAPDPSAIAFPSDRDQVALALDCARNASVKVSAFGAGHSFQAYGFGNPGNLVINMQAFNAVTYNPDQLTITHEGGSHVGPVIKHLWDTAGRHTPHVRSAHVGTAGSTIGGGFGSTTRHLGTPLDNIVAVEIMLYNGTIIHAGPGHDLFWAAQGAAASYGIVLSLTSKTYQPDYEKAINFTLTLGDSRIFDVEAAAQAIIATQEFAELPNTDEFAFRWALTSAPFTATGYYYGDPAAFDAALAPLLTKLKAINSGTVVRKTELSWWDHEVAVNGAGMNQPNGGTLGGRSFFIQSFVTTTENPLTLEQARIWFTNTVINYNRTDIRNSGFFDLWGGVSRDISDADTAWAHGKAQWLIRFDGVSADINTFPADGTSFLKSVTQPFADAISANGAPLRGFINYGDTELTEEEWSSRFYGEANYKRLQAIKAELDPEDVFNNHLQSIQQPRVKCRTV
ncbi:Chitooligosaccharide oxidase [Paramyrothecium foliicola]|nr:Chitooligosaccharide oxidase [Paramyrothecium foliicola]